MHGRLWGVLSVLLLVLMAIYIGCGPAPGASSEAVLMAPTGAPRPSTTDTLTAPAAETPAPPIASAPERITVEEVKKLLDSGASLLFVDTRARTQFNQGHIAGAMSLPEDETGSRYQELPTDRLIITYCT